jgi:hypothetical protein
VKTSRGANADRHANPHFNYNNAASDRPTSVTAFRLHARGLSRGHANRAVLAPQVLLAALFSVACLERGISF